MRFTVPTLTVPDGSPNGVKVLARTLSDAFGLLTSALRRVPVCQYVDVASPSTANASFTVQHSLGRVPTSFTYLAATNVAVYATANDIKQWSDRAIQIRCTGANAYLRLRIDAEGHGVTGLLQAHGTDADAALWTMGDFTNATHNHQNAAGGGQLDHGAALTGLTDDDHTQYALLAGRSGGQTLTGGTASGDDLTIRSTGHGTKGNINFGTSTYDEVNNRLGLGESSPDELLHLTSGTTFKPVVKIENTNADANPPGVQFAKNSASPADNDELGQITFRGNDDGATDTLYAYIVAKSLDVTNTDEGGSITVFAMLDGVHRNLIDLKGYNGVVGQGAVIINEDGQDVDFRVESDTNTHAIFMDAASGNTKFGGSAVRGTSEGTNHIDIFDGTAPAGTLANGVSLYSASGELRVLDAAGNSTLLSPHDKKTNEWIYYSKNTVTGKVLRIDMERMLKFLNDKFGTNFVHEE